MSSWRAGLRFLAGHEAATDDNPVGLHEAWIRVVSGSFAGTGS